MNAATACGELELCRMLALESSRNVYSAFPLGRSDSKSSIVRSQVAFSSWNITSFAVSRRTPQSDKERGIILMVAEDTSMVNDPSRIPAEPPKAAEKYSNIESRSSVVFCPYGPVSWQVCRKKLYQNKVSANVLNQVTKTYLTQ